MAGESISLPPWSSHKYEQADTKGGWGGGGDTPPPRPR